MDRKLLQSFQSPDGKRRVDLYERPDGLFGFEESYEEFEDMSGHGTESFTYWAPGYQSGLYDFAEAAKKEIFAAIPWLRDRST